MMAKYFRRPGGYYVTFYTPNYIIITQIAMLAVPLV